MLKHVVNVAYLFVDNYLFFHMVLNLIKINQRTREVDLLILRDKLLLHSAPTLQSETKEMETKH